MSARDQDTVRVHPVALVSRATKDTHVQGCRELFPTGCFVHVRVRVRACNELSDSMMLLLPAAERSASALLVKLAALEIVEARFDSVLPLGNPGG